MKAVKDELCPAGERSSSPEVPSGVGISPANGAAGHVHNVVVRLPWRRPGLKVMLPVHYDSAPTSPGAADDSASVAAMLETLRALRADGPLEHDVIGLLADGQEPGLLGARLFVARHPLARQVGIVLRVADVSYDLAASGMSGPRPVDLVAQPFGSRETIQAVRTVSLNP